MQRSEKGGGGDRSQHLKSKKEVRREVEVEVEVRLFVCSRNWGRHVVRNVLAWGCRPPSSFYSSRRLRIGINLLAELHVKQRRTSTEQIEAQSSGQACHVTKFALSSRM